MMGRVGALVTLELPGDSPLLELPWIITIGPMRDEEDWEPVVCGPYERPHALALAESVVADQDLMAVVEPVQPYATVDQIRSDVAASRAAAEMERAEAGRGGVTSGEGVGSDVEYGGAEYDPNGRAQVQIEPTAPPTPEEIKAGFVRIAERLVADPAAPSR